MVGKTEAEGSAWFSWQISPLPPVGRNDRKVPVARNDRKGFRSVEMTEKV